MIARPSFAKLVVQSGRVPPTAFGSLNARSLATISAKTLLPMVDLRSDTVTQPTPAMLATALTARTGDDVMAEDPTVQKLQTYVASLLGKEAALYVPTCSMANLCAMLATCHTRAAEVLLGRSSHMQLWEGGNLANVGGISTSQLVEDAHTAQFDLNAIRRAHRPPVDDHWPHTRALCVENTHNMLGGVPLSPHYLAQLRALADELDLQIHMDGARLFNAVHHFKVTPTALCASVDTVAVCLSKGLGAPLGSLLVGRADTIFHARRARKRLGGGMRQAGVVAAMGLYALQHHVERLVDDHTRAQHLAALLQQADFYLPRAVDTNIFYFGLPPDCDLSRQDFLQQCQQQAVQLTGGYARDDGELYRVVTHLNVEDAGIERAAQVMIQVARDNKRN